VLTGSYLACLGKTGKVIYIAIISALISTVINRFVFFFKEKSGQLDFLLDPLHFLDSSQGIEENVHLKQFKTASKKIKTVNFERMFLFFMGNTNILFTTILNIKLFGSYTFIIGFVSHAVHSWFHLQCNVVIGCLWKISLAFIQMRLLIIRDKIMDNNQSISFILKELSSFQDQVKRFDSCLKWFLFSSFASFTPLFCTMLHTSFYGEFSEGGLMLKLVIFLMLPVFLMENVIPMFFVAKIWSVSTDTYKLMQKRVYDSRDRISTHDRIKALEWMKALTSKAGPLAPLTITGEPFTPIGFFHYVMGIVCNFLMLTDMLH